MKESDDKIQTVMDREDNEHPFSETDKCYEKDFRLIPSKDFDSQVCPWFPVGMMASYPDDLVQKVAAAANSFSIGIKSTDNSLKTYPSHSKFSLEHNLSTDINNLFREIDCHILQTYKNLGDRSDDPEGLFIADLNIMRMGASLQCVRTTANRGFYFETIVLARFCLEQIAWISVCSKITAEQALTTLATRCISSLKTIYPSAGKLYGFLSDIHHWNPSHHHLFITDNSESVIWTHSKFKARALCIIIIIYDLLSAIFDILYEDRKSKNLAIQGGKLIGDRTAAKLLSRVIKKFPWDDELGRIEDLFSYKSL